VRKLLDNPEDTQLAFAVLRAMRGRSISKSFRRFASSSTGRTILERRSSLLNVLCDRAALAKLPNGSVGRVYFEFVQAEDLSAEGLVGASQDSGMDELPPDVRFYVERMRDAHDLTHVLTGYGRDRLGEICLQAFMYAHTGNTGMAMLAAMAGARICWAGRRAILEGWLNGRRARWFQDQDFEALLPRQLEEVRRQIRVRSPKRYLALSDGAALMPQPCAAQE
jgi:ubiquinone biosynthesis protein COQ4